MPHGSTAGNYFMVSPVVQNKFTPLSVLLMRLLVSITLLTFSQFALAEELTEETTEESHNAAIEIVEHLHTNLLEVMQAADTMNFAERYLKLEPTITESFDTPVITKVIVVTGKIYRMNNRKISFIFLIDKPSPPTHQGLITILMKSLK
jgi:hypothetical protein